MVQTERLVVTVCDGDRVNVVEVLGDTVLKTGLSGALNVGVDVDHGMEAAVGESVGESSGEP